MNNLLSLLQPKEYKSKIKLYTRNCEFSLKRFGQMEIKQYISQINITEKL